MLILSAVYDTPERGYAKMAENMRQSAEALGYEVILQGLRDDPMDLVRSPHDYQVNCFFKPQIIMDALDHIHEDIAWIDGDCLIRKNFDEILDDCDMAVTLRRFIPNTLRDVYDGYVNAGVMAFRNNERTRKFIEAWIGQLPHGRADQDALNRVLLDYTDMNKYGEIVTCDGGCRVKIVSCDVYNFFYFPEDYKRAKILHIKGSMRPEYYQKCVEEICQNLQAKN
jgi:hypothetical protein